MQNAHLNFYSAEVPRLTMPFGEAACCLVSASALKLTNNYTYITHPPPPPFAFHIISITLYTLKDNPAIISVCKNFNLSESGMFIARRIKKGVRF